MAMSPTIRQVFGRVERHDKRIRHGADNPSQLVGVPATELLDWAWLTIDLADWLAHAGPATQHDFADHFLHLRTAAQTAVFCEQISERIAALLDGDRGQP